MISKILAVPLMPRVVFGSLDIPNPPGPIDRIYIDIDKIFYSDAMPESSIPDTENSSDVYIFEATLEFLTSWLLQERLNKNQYSRLLTAIAFTLGRILKCRRLEKEGY